jgi:hypothetical protein
MIELLKYHCWKCPTGQMTFDELVEHMKTHEKDEAALATASVIRRSFRLVAEEMQNLKEKLKQVERVSEDNLNIADELRLQLACSRSKEVELSTVIESHAESLFTSVAARASSVQAGTSSSAGLCLKERSLLKPREGKEKDEGHLRLSRWDQRDDDPIESASPDRRSRSPQRRRPVVRVDPPLGGRRRAGRVW